MGGLLLGVASSALFFLDGRILGISGIVGRLAVAPQGDRLWRALFVAGMLCAGVAILLLHREWLAVSAGQSVAGALVAGALVGIGTRLGNGCTSGHGLCGIARLSPRSITGTVVFMAAGAATVFVARHVLHAGTP